MDKKEPLLELLSSKLKQELKDLINEVLDEREKQKKLNGPYDVYENENESDEWLYRGTYQEYNISMTDTDFSRIANSLERIATALEHFNIEHAHIDAIDHNHIDGDVNTHAKTW